jgi:hypothetical protein
MPPAALETVARMPKLPCKSIAFVSILKVPVAVALALGTSNVIAENVTVPSFAR